MTKEEAIEFVTGLQAVLVQAPVVNVAIDATKWEEFKVVVLAALTAAPVDPKFEAALRAANIKIDEANAIVDEVLG